MTSALLQKSIYLSITSLLSTVNISSIFFWKIPLYSHSYSSNLYHIALIFLPMEIKSFLIKAILKERA